MLLLHITSLFLNISIISNISYTPSYSRGYIIKATWLIGKIINKRQISKFNERIKPLLMTR